MSKNWRPHKGDFRCGVCGGADQDPRGQGRRCYGGTTEDGWVHCTRVQSRWPDKSGTIWAHPPDRPHGLYVPEPKPAQPTDEQGEARRRRALEKTRAGTLDLGHSAAAPVRLYLERRGLAGVSTPVLRCHPRLRYYEDGKLVGTMPAMIAFWQGPDGRLITLHRTYLTLDGQKAPVPNPRKLMKAVVPGTTSGGAIRLTQEPGARLAIAEGIETALAFGRLTGWPVWSTYSTAGMRSVVLPATVREVAIAADHDPDGLKAANALAKRLLAEGRRVKILTPPGFKSDWNDVLLKEGKPA